MINVQTDKGITKHGCVERYNCKQMSSSKAEVTGKCQIQKTLGNMSMLWTLSYKK